MPLADLFLGRPAHTPHAQASAAADEGVTIYWRNGCPFCVRLRAGVRKQRDRATWVDIWQDVEAAAYVRSVNNGNETVPTVVIDGIAHTNPAPGIVKEALAAR